MYIVIKSINNCLNNSYTQSQAQIVLTSENLEKSRGLIIEIGIGPKHILKMLPSNSRDVKHRRVFPPPRKDKHMRGKEGLEEVRPSEY